jgi:hypothetical protein
LLSCTLELAACSEYLLIGLKWFLFKEALYNHVDILLPLAINYIADDAVRRWKRRKKLLKYLILVKSIFHFRVNNLDMPSKALNVCLRILDIAVFRHSVYNELMEILTAYGWSFLAVSLFKRVLYFLYALIFFNALFIYITDADIDIILCLYIGFFQALYICRRDINYCRL